MILLCCTRLWHDRVIHALQSQEAYAQSNKAQSQETKAKPEEKQSKAQVN